MILSIKSFTISEFNSLICLYLLNNILLFFNLLCLAWIPSKFLSIVFSNVSKFYEINLVYINHLLTDKEFQEVKNKLDDELIKLAQEYDQDEIEETEKVLKKENKNVRNKRWSNFK